MVTESREVLDGQKRLSSFYLFLSNTSIECLMGGGAFLPIWKTTDLSSNWVDLASSHVRETSHVTFNLFHFLFRLVFETLRVSNLVMKVALRALKMPKPHMNEVVFMYMLFMDSSLIFLLLNVLEKYLKIECFHEPDVNINATSISHSFSEK